MKLSYKHMVSLALLLTASPAAFADIGTATAKQAQSGALTSYDRVLPLQGGSNFRDLGGYRTEDGKTVRKGLLFRSGVMTGLTETDRDYLAGFGIDSVVDLRSRDEIELYPNHWAQQAGINFLAHDYGFAEMMAAATSAAGGGQLDIKSFYPNMLQSLKPQLALYFEQALAGNAPLVVNCSAGQDRTGMASALMLSALGVPREHVVQDYVLSTEYRRPLIERGNVNLEERAKDNAFAAIMQRYAGAESTKASPLITDEGIPYLYYVFQKIDADYGSVEGYLEQELGIGSLEIARLRAQYLE